MSHNHNQKFNPFKNLNVPIKPPEFAHISIDVALRTNSANLKCDIPINGLVLVDILLTCALQIQRDMERQNSMLVGQQKGLVQLSENQFPERENNNGKENNDSDKGNTGSGSDGPGGASSQS